VLDVQYLHLIHRISSVLMKSLAVYIALAASWVSASVFAIANDAVSPESSINLPRSNLLSSRNFLPVRNNHKQKDNWGNAIEKDRKKVTIRASKDDRDDVSDEFLAAIKKANGGGLVHLKKGHKYVIGKKLDLTFLDDIYITIDGELKVSSCRFLV
jgi:galacturan 1,4-alpha-galacturonidase